jgi:hypothetical protein
MRRNIEKYGIFHSESVENPRQHVTKARPLNESYLGQPTIRTRIRGADCVSMPEDSALLANENRTKRTTTFRIRRESSILLHPLPILPRNPHI